MNFPALIQIHCHILRVVSAGKLCPRLLSLVGSCARVYRRNLMNPPDLQATIPGCAICVAFL